MSHRSVSKANTSPSTRFPLSTRAAPICRAPHRHSTSRIHSQAGLAVGPLALFILRPQFRPPQRSPPRRPGSLLAHWWLARSKAGPSPALSRPADLSHRPVVCLHCAPSLPAASSALQAPFWFGGSSTRGGSAAPSPPPDSGAASSGAAAFPSLAAGCRSPLPGWGPPSRSSPPPGSSPPWAVPCGTPGVAAQVSDAALATLSASRLLRSPSPRCNGSTEG